MLEEHRRELLKALYSTERLAHLFRRTTYYSEDPSRAFLDALWVTVETGSPPPFAVKKSLRSYLNSDRVPSEAECIDADHLGQQFILSLHLLLSFLKKREQHYLEYIWSGVEATHIDGLAIDEAASGSGKSTILITKELADKAHSLPVSVNFRKQLETDQEKAQSIPLNRAAIESSKVGSTDEISRTP
ncbi:hypothetical protein C1926_14030 [Stenotrophomonas sp. ZAC14A_NAIMI4_1]|nr:hypothetical protein C1926_14030 [Stenotrophomonas sp. ZAC14A_NAIMI4_1]